MIDWIIDLLDAIEDGARRLFTRPVPPPPPPPPPPELTIDELHDLALREESAREAASRREEEAARWAEDQRLAEQNWHREQAERARRAHERAMEQKVERVRLGLPPVEPEPAPPPPPVEVKAFIQPPPHMGASGYWGVMGTGYAYPHRPTYY